MRKRLLAHFNLSRNLTMGGLGLATGRGLAALSRAEVARAGRGDDARNADGDSTLHEMDRRRLSGMAISVRSRRGKTKEASP